MPSTTNSSNYDRLDRATILERVEGDEELLAEIVHLFIEDCPRLIGQMRECLATKDAFGLRMAAHTLKGSLGYFGPSKSYALAVELEAKSRDTDLDRTAPLCDALIASLTELQPALLGLLHKPT